MHLTTPRACALALALTTLTAHVARAQDTTTIDDDEPDVPPGSAVELDRIVVEGRRLNLVGDSISASEGTVGRSEIAGRSLLRSGDLLEFVPGLVATQHSGSGKANQYFLRGFNLDHGTDFATFVDAMPVNMRTHAHGQGYTDLNFLIPETVEELHYRKGPYYAEVGDFSSAGSARFAFADRVARGSVAVTAGDHGYLRGVLVDSRPAGGGDLLYAVETLRDDGPWTDIDEDVRKTNGMLRFSGDVGGGRGSVTLLGYDNRWNAADQIPRRAVEQGLIDSFGSLDPTAGGESSRHSISAQWDGTAFGGELAASVYGIDYKMDLYSNFTYFLEDPVDGDQFRQFDERRIAGFALSQQWRHGRSRWRIGAQGRLDDVERVGLYRARAQRVLGVVREDAVVEGSVGVHVANEFAFDEHWRSYVGVRHDRYAFDVDALSLPANSGTASDDATSFKASIAWKPSAAMEWYASYGQGFHSNDARGTTIRIDPASGEPATPVDPIVASEGHELGARLYFNERLHATAALWSLRLDSELLFVGDAGTTEGSRPSRRDGLEVGLYWFGNDRLEGDLEASWTRARFDDGDPAGDEVPGAIPMSVSAGLTARSANGWLGTMRIRHFAGFPLVEDDSARSDGSTLVNLRVAREWRRVSLAVDLLNALDSDDHDIDYFYASRLPGEPAAGVEDLHYHPLAPRTVRVSVRYAF